MKKYFNRLFLNDIRKAIDDFNMIKNGDIVLVGLSGGKDSTLLLYALKLLRDYSHMDFKLIGVHIDYGWEMDFSSLIDFCEEENIDIHIEKTDIAEHLDFENGKNVCSLCARFRKGAMARVAKMYNATKIAYGHHMDDAVETFLMNLIYTGKLGSFSPNNYDKDKRLHIIRPMIYVKEENIKKVVSIENLPEIKSNCPLNGFTTRQEIKELVKFLEEEYKDIREKIIKSLSNVYEEGLWKKGE
ncbi:tRNA lysidine(34) synthetase [Tepidibacter thalassicus]|uniref:tRNA(Ile)-lysidine synthetase, N-terminal domain-containing protein n=1 Tax=Tepidibacter thalassicus DSM 15285 TaxID=1123350 RepID=A0A1M5SB61_9FIRM|nr:ATP-binding protein [Tepidibacter thalassicus]SHH35153.1 tRNA(Ile)-lysidine synthetase, N-terminal domain-containing protein [Tepidibacter thalassicus DSM 15285]